MRVLMVCGSDDTPDEQMEIIEQAEIDMAGLLNHHTVFPISLNTTTK
jgi:hypothetical protein